MKDNETPVSEVAEPTRRFQLVLDNIELPIWYVDRDLVYRVVNRPYAEMFGVNEAQIIGLRVPDVIGGEVFGQVREHVMRVLEGARISYEREAEWRGRGRRRIRVTLLPDVRASGEIEGMYGVVNDVEDDHRLRDALRERAEQLAAAESRIRLFTDNIPEPVAYLNADYRYTFVNQAYSRLVGLPLDAILGKGIAAVIGTDAADWFAPFLQRIRAGERATYQRLRTEKDGRERWMHGVLVPDMDGAVFKGVYVVIHDITDLKVAQTLLAQREGQLRAFMDGIPAPVAFVNSDWKYEFVNRAFVDFSDRPADRILGRSVEDISQPEDYPRHAALLERAFAGEPITYERLTPFAKQAARWMQVRLVPEHEADGRIGGVFILLNDIHAQKENEAAIRHINWVLSSHIENTPMAVMEWDHEFKVIRWSKRAEAIFGWSAEEVLGSTPKRRGLVFEEDVEKVDAIIAEMMTGQRNSTTSIHRNNRKDGAVIWCEWHNSVLRNESGRVLSVLSFVQDISDRVDAQARLETMATHDALTGLPNRVLLHRHLAEALDRARVRERQLAVLFIDLDRFKNVNDSLGHRIGDELLQMIGRRLGMALRKGDFLARLGGDEFTVLLENLQDGESAGPVAAKLLELIQQPYWVRGHPVHVSASIGLSLFPDDAEDPDTLLKNADVAMYRAKDAGKNVYQFFSREMGAEQQERMALETALRQAIKDQTLELAFQPKVEVATGRIVGAEALVRWRDPVLGEIPATRFIPLAEESGLIEMLGDRVLQKACEQAQHWLSAGLGSLTIAINLSVRQFRDPGFAARIQRIFDQTGIDPHRVEFEVTETSVLYDPETVSDVLQLERELGVRVAIDDFGTGYSSLVHLKRLPIDTLKIDQSFIRNVNTDADDRAITAAIIALAHSLGLDVVAEGVETAEQLAVLAAQGCDFYQGHLFSVPLAPAAFIALALRAGTPATAPPA